MLMAHWIILAMKYQPLVKMCIFFNIFSKYHLHKLPHVDQLYLKISFER